MLNSLTGLQGLQQAQGLQSFYKPEFGNIGKLDNFLIPGQNMQGLGNLNQLGENLKTTDLSKITDNDPELKADLQGLVEKNQFNKNSDFSEVNTGDVANKFSDVLGHYLNGVNDQNKTAEKAVETFASGGNIDLHSVMIATEKANLSMQLAVQMKNKILQAYQEVSKTQV